MTLTGKTAIITGASKGIGEAIAAAMARAGARVIVSSRKQEAVEAVAARLRAEGYEAQGVAANAGERADCEALVEATLDHYGRIDILVNNAATNPAFGPILQLEDWAWDKIMGVNLKGPFDLARLCHPHMKQQGGGAVINIASVEGFTPNPGLGAYSISKAALIMLTKVLAQEWGPDAIRVNAIAPGLIETKLSSAITANPGMMKMIMGKQALKRTGQPDDIAGLAVLLASEAGSFITGATLTADGGLTI
ncbi:MAG: SDR family oxidoreductase [Bacteroidetes bacterium]|nr:MAG: SDR family oxidoreductase [Bacteroidota bacterium]